MADSGQKSFSFASGQAADGRKAADGDWRTVDRGPRTEFKRCSVFPAPFSLLPSPIPPLTLSSFRTLILLLPFFLAFPLSGCGLTLFSSGQASIAAHSVFLTHPGCSTFAAQTLREGMTLVETTGDDYAPAAGDVFEGPARIGPSMFRLFDGTEARLSDGGRNISLTIVAKNLSPEDARRQLNATCR